MAVLGASNYTFAKATYTQSLSDWLLSHVRMLEFFGGVPEILVPAESDLHPSQELPQEHENIRGPRHFY